MESYNAVPIVRDVMKAYFDKKAREENRLTRNMPLVKPFAAPGFLRGSRAVVRRRAPLVPVYRSIRDLDWTLLIVTLALCGLGILQIYSATLTTKWEDAWWKQIVWVVSGLALMWVASNIDYHMLLGRVTYLYVGSVALLIMTAVAGNKVFGSTRWIRVAGFTCRRRNSSRSC